MKNLTEGEKITQLLMRQRPTCYDCPAADFCKESNMSCEENRLQCVNSSYMVNRNRQGGAEVKPYIGFSPPLTRKQKFGIAFVAPLTLLVIVMAVFIGVSEYLWLKFKRRVQATCGKEVLK